MKKTTILFSILSLMTFCMQAQWEENRNPGAGGQVQDIVCDPNTNMKVFLASDMEGYYLSEDNGENWDAKGKLKQNRVYAVAITPGNSNKMYIGTLYGLEVSNNGGTSSSMAKDASDFALTRKKSIGAIAISPKNTGTVIAGLGWRDDQGFADDFDMSTTGDIVTYRSTNGGDTWERITISNGTNDRNIYTIEFDKTNAADGQIAYMGTSQGVFKTINAGESWFALGNNPSTNSGVGLSPDGKTLYGTFDNVLYVTPTSNINWQSKMTDLPVTFDQNGTAQPIDYWYPEVDPRSNGSSHKVLVAVLKGRGGLFEGTFNWSGDNLDNYTWKKIWGGLAGYDEGWDQAPPEARVAHYTPLNWPRAIWSTSNQTMFRAVENSDTGNDDWGWDWSNKYSNKNTGFNVGGTSTYSSKGTASTFTYGVSVLDNYVLQTMGDNGWVESWDGGKSWSNKQMRDNGLQSDSRSSTIGKSNGNDIVVTEASSSCFGGYCFGGGMLWTKTLSTTPKTTDTWYIVADSYKPSILPYPNSGQYECMAVSPVKKERLFTVCSDYGVYLLDDIGASATGNNALKLIGMAGIRAKNIVPHPTDENIVYVTSKNGEEQPDNPNEGPGVYKGEKNDNDDDWTFNKILSGAGEGEVSVWTFEGQFYMFYFGKRGNEFKGVLTLDEDFSNFETVMDSDTAKALRTPSWYSAVQDDFEFISKGGMIGFENKVVLNYYDHLQQQTYGVFRGTISGSTIDEDDWEDWSGTLHFGGGTSAIIAKDYEDNKNYYYSGTAGAGMIRREWTSSDSNTTNQSPTVSLTSPADNTTFDSGSNITVNANANDSDGSILKVEFYRDNVKIDEDSTSPYSVTWNNSTQGVFALTAIAFDNDGATTTSLVRNITVSAPTGGCTNPNFIGNNNFNNSGDQWESYYHPSASANDTYPNGGGFSGQAVKITITNGGTQTNHVQFKQKIGAITNGKTYEVSFKAKATASRNLIIGVLKSVDPWTGIKYESVNLNTSIQNYNFEFTANQSMSDPMLDFFLGNELPNVWIDEVVFKEKCNTTTTIIPTSVSISGCPSSNMSIGSTANLVKNVIPNNATNDSVTWSSSNNSVATVSSSGLITAIGGGSADITVTTNSGNKSAICNINVNANNGGGSDSVVVRARLLNGSSDQLQFRVDGTTEETWTVSSTSFANYTTSLSVNGNVRLFFPDNGTDMEIDYIIINGTTYQAENQSINTAVWQNGSCGGSNSSIMHCSGYIDFGSIGGGSSTIPVTSVVVSNCSSVSLSVGGTVDLNYNVLPNNASNDTVTWSSSNTSVATVNSSTGFVTAIGNGSANITVTTVDGGFSSGCSIMVTGGGGSSTAYRYLRLNGTGTVGNDVTLQQIEWMVGSNSYPNPKLTWATRWNASASNANSNNSNVFGAFDNTNNGWSVGSSYPAWIVIDLGSGNEIVPDAIKIKPNASDRGFSGFDCEGSNDNSSWTPLFSTSGLSTSTWSSGLTTFIFGNSTQSRSSKSKKEFDNESDKIDSNFSIYPNPLKAGSELFIALQVEESFQVLIHDITGKIIFQQKYDETIKSPVRIEIKKELSSGLYLLKFNSKSQNTYKRLIIK